MKNFAQDPLAINVSNGADSSLEIHHLRNMGVIPHALSTGSDEISHPLPYPNPFDQAGVSSTELGENAHVLPSPIPFDQGGAYSHSLKRESPIEGGVIQVEGSCHRFSLDAIRIATSDFDETFLVGEGGFGKVYKSHIKDGATITAVAIKRLNTKSNQGAEEFWTEVKLLSKFCHTNLVPVIGYCYEKPEMILVYKYIAHGTLASHLYKSRKEERGKSIYHLFWAQRLKICLGAARGLDYLHNGTKQRIIHRDVKTTNILLDENWVAKVSDFGICKLITSQTTTHVSTEVKATKGYWDPDYIYTNRVTRKADVYAFGVVLLEVLCGRPPLDDRLKEEEISLVLWAKKNIENGKLDRIIDPSLKGEATPPSLMYFAKLANNCLRIKPKERPRMSEVVEMLQNALALHERKGRIWGTITMAFQGMNLCWREGKGNSSNDGGGLPKQSFPAPIFKYQRWVYPRFSLAGIRAATNNFNKGLMISQDKYSRFRLYKGYEVGGSPVVAIKRFKSRRWRKEYNAEIRVHSLTRHPNIASLMGFCNENGELILVYNYMVNGTLKRHLHETDNDPLLWEKRLEICIDTAQGLEYLHMNVEQQLVHCDIKPSNVLLDHKWVAKVAAFEHSVPIFTSIATEGEETDMCGTLGCLDPEYQHNRKVTKKTDVYAFGVMLLEVLCAKALFYSNRNTDEVLLLDWFRSRIKRGTIDEVIDRYLIGKIAPECLRQYVNIALTCVVKEGIRRPSMNDVLLGLQSSLQMQEAWENSLTRMADVPRSYNNVISVESEFTIGGQSYLISDLVRPWSAISSL